MSDGIIVLNAGSSSLKCSIHQISEQGEPAVVARGQVQGLGTRPHFKVKDRARRVSADAALTGRSGRFGHAEAFAQFVEWMRAEFGGRLTLAAVGHRVVHGALEFTEPTLLNDEIVEKVDRLVPLAPLHQPYSLAGVRAVSSLRPDLPQVACFDTAFHHGRPSATERCGLPDELFQRGVRRSGFHGLSYASIVDHLRQVAPDLVAGRIIVARLGSGASMCAIRAAEAIEFFVCRAAREIGSLVAALGGLDALIFTAGIGENSPVIRHRICGALGWLGVAIDQAANERGRGCISPAGRAPSVRAIPTDEERVIAAGTWRTVRAAAAAAAVSKRASSGAGV